MAYSLPLVNPDDINAAFEILVQEASLISPNDEELKAWLLDFIQYLRDTWVVRFPVRKWNHYSSTSMEHLTNNVSVSIKYYDFILYFQFFVEGVGMLWILFVKCSIVFF